VITFETNKKNTNVVHISNEKDIYCTPKTQKRFVYAILITLEQLAKNAFSARQKAFLKHNQNMLKQITGTYSIPFYLLFGSSKRRQC
jgi:hypothetical protein